MSYQHGYQPQQPDVYQDDYPEQGTGNPATAVIAGKLGLVASAGLTVAAIENLGIIPEGLGFGDLPTEVQTFIIVRIAAAAILLAGAVLVLARRLAGAFALVLGGLAGITGILLYPLLLDLDLVTYLDTMFRFEGAEAAFTAIALIASPLALILVILPPTLNHLKGATPKEYADFPHVW